MMASQSGVANTYLYSKNIPHLFESLLTGLMYHRPEDPIAFLQNCLEEAKKREGQYSWNCFVTTTNSRSVFSRTKPLPPIQRPASAATPKEKENCTETLTVEHTPPSAGENRAATVQDKPLVFIIGGPGCGKGTQCEKIVSEFGLAHLSAGDLLRAEVARGSRQGERIQEIMREGELVPPEVTIGLLKSAILSRSEAIGFLIDGFPRELSQAHMFESQVGECSVVVMLECSEEVMLERLRRRGETSSRVDDNQETIRKRLVTFSQSTLPVIQHYQKLGKVKLVNADQMVDKVYGEVKEIFQELLTKQ